MSESILSQFEIQRIGYGLLIVAALYITAQIADWWLNLR